VKVNYVTAALIIPSSPRNVVASSGTYTASMIHLYKKKIKWDCHASNRPEPSNPVASEFCMLGYITMSCMYLCMCVCVFVRARMQYISFCTQEDKVRIESCCAIGNFVIYTVFPLLSANLMFRRKMFLLPVN
jgi:hypothetical protein